MGVLVQSKERKTVLLIALCVLVAHFGLSFQKISLVIDRIKDSQEAAPVKEIVIKLAPRRKNPEEKQIVSSLENNKKSEDAKFLGKTDSFFHRETQARINDKYNVGAKGQQNANADYNRIRKTKNNSKAKQKTKKSFALDSLSFNPLNHVPKPAEETKVKKGTKYGNKTSRGIASNNDFVEDIPLGEFSRLNTQEYKFYGFYFRIKQQLEDLWGYSLQQKARAIYSQGRRLPASVNLITDVEVELNTKGEITKMRILGTSGVKELDDAAVESFNKAGPFPNPPKELVKDGKAVIKWGFVVKR